MPTSPATIPGDIEVAVNDAATIAARRARMAEMADRTRRELAEIRAAEEAVAHLERGKTPRPAAAEALRKIIEAKRLLTHPSNTPVERLALQ